MRRTHVLAWLFFAVLGFPGILPAQEPAEELEAYWNTLYRGSQAAQTCLEDVIFDGPTDVPCAEMLPAFLRAEELAREVEACCPEEASFEMDGGGRATLANFALAHRVLADSVATYAGRSDEEVRSRKVGWAGQLLAWRTLIDRFLQGPE